MEEIGFCIGSSWIPDHFYADFAKEILGLKMYPKVSRYSEEIHQWKVEDLDRAWPGANWLLLVLSCATDGLNRDQCFTNIEWKKVFDEDAVVRQIK